LGLASLSVPVDEWLQIDNIQPRVGIADLLQMDSEADGLPAKSAPSALRATSQPPSGSLTGADQTVPSVAAG